MNDAIRIQDAAIEISGPALESLLAGRGTALTVKRLDLLLSPEALNALLVAAAPAGTPAPTATVGDAHLRLAGERDGKPLVLDLQVKSLTVLLTADGIRIASA